VEWSGVEWSGVEWSGVEWSGVEWSGVEWSGVEWRQVLCSQVESSPDELGAGSAEVRGGAPLMPDVRAKMRSAATSSAPRLYCKPKRGKRGKPRLERGAAHAAMPEREGSSRRLQPPHALLPYYSPARLAALLQPRTPCCPTTAPHALLPYYSPARLAALLQPRMPCCPTTAPHCLAKSTH